MKVLVALAGVVVGLVGAAIGTFVALVVGLAMAGSGDRATGSDVLFLLPFGLFTVVSLLMIAVPAARRFADGLLAVAGGTCAVLLVGAAFVVVSSGIQRL